MENGKYIDVNKPRVEIMPSARPAESERRRMFRATHAGGRSTNKNNTKKSSTVASVIDRVS